jgi:hypothetical protein
MGSFQELFVLLSVASSVVRPAVQPAVQPDRSIGLSDRKSFLWVFALFWNVSGLSEKIRRDKTLGSGSCAVVRL